MQRNIVVSVILSIVTCGIYGIIWMIKLNDELNALANKQGATSGGMVFLTHTYHLRYLRLVLVLQDG